MLTGCYIFRFVEAVHPDDAELALGAAILAAEGLFGVSCVRLSAVYRRMPGSPAFIIDGSTPVGEAVVKMFTGFLIRQFGEDSFKVDRDGGTSMSPAAEHTAAA